MTQKEQHGREHVGAWRESGLTQREYCSRNGLSRSALGYWSRKIDSEGKGGGFVEIRSVHDGEAGNGSDAIELVVGERYRLRLGEGFSPQTLARVLEVLEGR